MRGMIQIVNSLLEGQLVFLHHQRGVGKKEIGVGLQVDDAAVSEEAAVALHEIGGGESLAGILHLWVAESKPNLLHLVLSKETVDDLYVRAEEGHILYSLLQSTRGSRPHTGTLDVNADVVAVRVCLRQLYGIFALAATQLQDDGVVVMKELLAPVAAHGKRNVTQHRIGVLKDVPIGFHVGELRQLSFAHELLFVIT